MFSMCERSLPVAINRLDAIEELKDIPPIIHSIKNEKNNLCKISSPKNDQNRCIHGLASLIYLCQTKIMDFEPSQNERPSEKISSYMNLVNDLVVIFDKTINEYGQTFSQVEISTNNSDNAKRFLLFTGIASVIGIAAENLPCCIYFFCCLSSIYGKINTSVSELVKASRNQLRNKYASLNYIYDQLTSDFLDNTGLFCPITRQKIRHPVLCLLDKHLYEKNSIIRHLSNTRTSPINRKRMSDDETVDDVLVEAINLRNALQEYYEMESKLRDDNSPAVRIKMD